MTKPASSVRFTSMLLACSHLVLATDDVPRITRFFADLFSMKPGFENEMFSEFILTSQFRIAFFKPVGVSAKSFRSDVERNACAFGLTVSDVDAIYQRAHGNIQSSGISISGAPKTHPWGEKSFLLTDPDGNRWEITQSPSRDGMLVAKEYGK